MSSPGILIVIVGAGGQLSNETDLILMRATGAEELWAVLYLDLHQAMGAAAAVRAIKARMAGSR
jgi:hypothetical protein